MPRNYKPSGKPRGHAPGAKLNTDPPFEHFAVMVLYPHHSTRDVADWLGKKERYVKQVALRLGLKKEKSATLETQPRWTVPDIEFVMNHYNNDMSDVEIGAKIQRSKWAVVNMYREQKGLR